MQKTEDKTRNHSRAEISVHTANAVLDTESRHDPQLLSHRDRQEGAHFIAAEGAHFTPADDALVAPARVEP